MKAINSSTFIQFQNTIPIILNLLKKEQKCNQQSMEDQNSNHKFHINCFESKESLMLEESSYESIIHKILQLNEVIENGKSVSKSLEEINECIEGVLKTSEDKLNELYCNIKELNRQKKGYGSINDQENQLKQPLTHFELVNYQQLKQNILLTSLKSWSNKPNCNILFDSNINGDGVALHQTVFGKNNLSFIHFDNNGNVFGGHITITIDKMGIYIDDPNAYVFSLIRNGRLKNKQYLIGSDHSHAFILTPLRYHTYLYHFGRDIVVSRIGEAGSYCQPSSFQYNDENEPLSNDYQHKFGIQRIIVVEMI